MPEATATRVVATKELVKDSIVVGFSKLTSPKVVVTAHSMRPRFETVITAGFITDQVVSKITKDLLFIDFRWLLTIDY